MAPRAGHDRRYLTQAIQRTASAHNYRRHLEPVAASALDRTAGAPRWVAGESALRALIPQGTYDGNAVK